MPLNPPQFPRPPESPQPTQCPSISHSATQLAAEPPAAIMQQSVSHSAFRNPTVPPSPSSALLSSTVSLQSPQPSWRDPSPPPRISSLTGPPALLQNPLTPVEPPCHFYCQFHPELSSIAIHILHSTILLCTFLFFFLLEHGRFWKNFSGPGLNDFENPCYRRSAAVLVHIHCKTPCPSNEDIDLICRGPHVPFSTHYRSMF